jgi:hypothetical protein
MRIDASQSGLDPLIAARLKRDANGLVTAIAQQYDTGEVLMLAWMDDEALHRTLTTGRCTYWSRSRQEYWVKGETSGHAQVDLLGRRRPPDRPLAGAPPMAGTPMAGTPMAGTPMAGALLSRPAVPGSSLPASGD